MLHKGCLKLTEITLKEYWQPVPVPKNYITYLQLIKLLTTFKIKTSYLLEITAKLCMIRCVIS